jgi:hypothetical protein
MAAIAKLPVVERLVGNGQASHVDLFELEPEHQGSRHLRLIYTDPQRYAEREPRTRLPEGIRPWQSS